MTQAEIHAEMREHVITHKRCLTKAHTVAKTDGQFAAQCLRLAAVCRRRILELKGMAAITI